MTRRATALNRSQISRLSPVGGSWPSTLANAVSGLLLSPHKAEKLTTRPHGHTRSPWIEAGSARSHPAGRGRSKGSFLEVAWWPIGCTSGPRNHSQGRVYPRWGALHSASPPYIL